MAKPFSDKKLNLGEPLATRLKDFCAANYKAPAIEVIREALEEHITRRLKEPDLLARFERAQKVRTATKPNIELVHSNVSKPTKL